MRGITDTFWTLLVLFRLHHTSRSDNEIGHVKNLRVIIRLELGLPGSLIGDDFT